MQALTCIVLRTYVGIRSLLFSHLLLTLFCLCQGYKTGYVYRNPEIFQGETKPDREVTTPATVTTSRAKNPYYTPEIEREPMRRAHSTGRANTYRNRMKWLNTPVKATDYKKEKEKAEIDEDYEPAIIKDMQPEKEDKDVEVKFFFSAVISLIVGIKY